MVVSEVQYINPYLLLQGNIEAEQAEQRKREKEERKRLEEEQRQREADEAEAQRRADEEAAAAKAKVCFVWQGYLVPPRGTHLQYSADRQAAAATSGVRVSFPCCRGASVSQRALCPACGLSGGSGPSRCGSCP